MKLKIIIFFTLILITFVSCSRADENDDVLSQEDISNIILHVKNDATGVVKTYNYTANSVQNPMMTLDNGGIYTVSMVFKNGNQDVTQEIIDAKDEHFITFDFLDSNIQLFRIDGSSSTRSDGKKVGLLTHWHVIQAENGNQPQVHISVIHDAISVDETQTGTTFGSAQGGETDAVAYFDISN